MIVRVITPLIEDKPLEAAVAELARAARSDDWVEETTLVAGPASIESRYEDMIAAPETIAEARLAETQGCDAVLINCMNDPGLAGSRESVRLPVLGAAQSSLHLAALLADRFSILVVLRQASAAIQELVEIYGLERQVVSVRAVEIPVLELEKQRDRLAEALTDQAERAVCIDGAELVIFGCTGMAGLAQEVQNRLRDRGIYIPVIDPSIAALKLAEALVDLKLNHSQTAYPRPPTG